MKQSRSMAACGIMAALSIVILLLGAVLEIGVYAAPMFAGLCLLPVGYHYGKKYRMILWLAVSLLAFILVPNLEENLLYLLVFGGYPVFRPAFQRLSGLWRILTKLLYFNVVTVSAETLLLAVVMPEDLGIGLAAVLLVLGNITFLCYDFILPRAEKKLGALMKNQILEK